MNSPWTEHALVWADVTEFTRAMEVREQEMGSRTVAWVDRCVSGWLPELGGLFLQQAGDAVLLAFHDAHMAWQAALRLQHDWASLAPRSGHTGSHELRIALHWGRVMQGRHGYVAHSLNQLSRLAQRVLPGQIWCSESFRGHLTPQMQSGCEDLGWMYFRHLEQALRVFRAPLPLQAIRPQVQQLEQPKIRLMLQSDDGVEGDGWIQAWMQGLQGMDGLIASELTGALTADPRQAGEMMRHARADFVLRRRTRSVAQPRIELLAAPWGLVIQSWDAAKDPSTPPDKDWMLRELQEALMAHGVSTAKSQPESALSHGLLKGAALQMMHAGDLKDFKRAGDLLTTWCQRYKRHAQPHVWRALWHVMRHTRGLGRVDVELALAHAHKALQLEPEHAHARAALGFAMAHLHGDVENGLRHLDMAQKMAPQLHWPYLYRSVLWCLCNEPLRAMEEAQRALNHAPQDTLRGYALGLAGHAAVFDQQPALAVKWLESSWRQHRHYSPTLRMLVVAHEMQGQQQLARFFLRELLVLEPNLTARSYLARTRAGHARRAEMAHWLMKAGLPMK